MATVKTAKITGGACAVSAIIAIVLSMDTGLRINQAGLELIGNAESCRRDPYMCPARVLTVGIGSTGKVEHRRYADEEIAKMWVKDLHDAEKCINDKFKRKRDAGKCILSNDKCGIQHGLRRHHDLRKQGKEARTDYHLEEGSGERLAWNV